MSKPTLYLYTIPFSHYCEMARWALQEQRKSFIEYGMSVEYTERTERVQMGVLVPNGQIITTFTCFTRLQHFLSCPSVLALGKCVVLYFESIAWNTRIFGRISWDTGAYRETS